MPHSSHKPSSLDRGGTLNDLKQETRAIWDANARFWDERMGQEGNTWHRELIAPAVERLLAPKPGELVLEIACGNGQLARRLAALGARVVAIDFSAEMIDRARMRTQGGSVELRVADATQPDQLLALGARRFDAAVCNMALMDMAEIDPMFVAASRLLKSAGRLVVSQTHPCFNAAGCAKIVEESDQGGEVVRSHSIRVARYITPVVAKGLAMEGQPVAQNVFERPLSAILGAGFRAGFVVDGFEEPVFDRAAAAGKAHWIWGEFPPVVVIRFRLPGLPGAASPRE